MKKFYILFILTLTVSFAHAQTWAGFTNVGGDALWSNDTNWTVDGGGALIENLNIDIYEGPTAATLDEVYTAKRFRIPGNKTEHFTLTGDNMLTIDIANATQANANSGDLAIWSESATATTLSFDCDVTIANSVTPEQFKGVSVLSTATAGSIIEFATGKTLDIGGTSTTSFWGAGEVHVNGNIVGTQGILLGAGATVHFGSETSDISGYDGAITLASNSSLTLNSNGSTAATVNKVQVNASPATLTLEGQNVLTVTNEIRVSRQTGQAFILDMNVNANQTLSNIWLKGDGSVLNLNLDPSVTSVTFFANNANWHANAILNINGFQEGVVKFGSDNTALNGGAYLTKIQIDGAAPSEALALNSTGNLVYESSLSVKNYSAFDFTVYPNPVNDRLTINTQETLTNMEVIDLLGRTVLVEKNVSKSVDASSLNSGVYILKLSSDRGISTKKIIKK